jgi:uncharacterized protein YndB with AHSA1/START domain
MSDSKVSDLSPIVLPPAAGDLLYIVDVSQGVNGSAYITWGDLIASITAGNDELVKISANDTTSDYLISKIVAGSANITVTEVNDGGNETLEIDVVGGGTDELAKISANDTTSDYLINKIVAGSANITVTEVNDGGNETLEIDVVGGGTDELVKVTANDTTAAYLFDKIIAGSTKLTVTEVNDGANEDLSLDVDESNIDHGLLTGLADDDHTQYLLLAGRAGGQAAIGGTGGGENLTLASTSLTASQNLQVVGQAFSTLPGVLIPAGTTQAIDWDTGNGQEIDLATATGDVTITLNNPQAGASYILKVIQGPVARNLIWPVNVLWPGGTPPLISTVDDDEDVISLFFDGTNFYGTFSQGFA